MNRLVRCCGPRCRIPNSNLTSNSNSLEFADEIEIPETHGVVKLESFVFGQRVVLGIALSKGRVGELPLLLDPVDARYLFGNALGRPAKGLMGAHHDKGFRDFLEAEKARPGPIQFALRKVFGRSVLVGNVRPRQEPLHRLDVSLAQLIGRKGDRTFDEVFGPSHLDAKLSRRLGSGPGSPPPRRERLRLGIPPPRRVPGRRCNRTGCCEGRHPVLFVDGLFVQSVSIEMGLQ